MKIVDPSYQIITDISKGGIVELKRIEAAARECYASQDKVTEDGESAKKIVSTLIKNGHEAMLEFAPDIHVRFVMPRRIANEMVRHRLCSFAQQSTRYCNYGNPKFEGIEVVRPECFRNDKMALSVWATSCAADEDSYSTLLRCGYKPQDASGVLPLDLAAPIHVKTNVREWRNIFKLRTAHAAHPEMRRVMRPLLNELKWRIPIVFDDIDIRYPD